MTPNAWVKFYIQTNKVRMKWNIFFSVIVV
jgi:hypothetical protein